jgi:hypothetical protein
LPRYAMKKKVEPKKQWKSSWTWLLVSAAVLIIIIYFAVGRKNDEVTFTELYGIWRSHDPRYQKCYLIINNLSLVIGAADGKAYVYFLNSVEKKTAGGVTLYTFHSENPEGEEYDFWLNRDQSATSGDLHFKNQPNIRWYKGKQAFEDDED